ncbi:MAG TPA: TauD/TfdA family dioxygenase [Bradyrhizobium sp.]|jgi:alpha-ketoglutarate-dependent 2,4-dichlorophenoxyacetate dioxygenase|nr:TauD/TfdA family dioxygenase [Bradyrhizobium sp.]
MISVRQIHPLFAAEVTGADLAALTPDQVATLQDASNRHAVLVFPGQSLDDDRLLTLGRLFGEVEPPRNHRVQQRLKHAELADISNLTAANALRAPDDQRRLDSLGNRLWHSDASFREVPGALSMLFAHIVPPAGGETEFADLRAAYDALGAEMKAKIEDLVCEHSIFHSRGQLGHTDYTDAERAALPPVRHPLVRIHPGSRRRTLYMGSHASHIVGWPMPDGRLLLRDLMEHATQREFVYRHEWCVGDLVMWDNRCTLHRGRAYDDAAHPRDLRRVTTKDYYAAA